METLSEQQFIEKCKHLIECRLEWKNSKDWINRDFEALSEQILNKTKISLSVSTLKRIWKNNSERIPHTSTLDALALFIDYKSWNDFKAKTKNELLNKKAGPQHKKTRKKGFHLINGIMVAFIISAAYYIYSSNKNSNYNIINPRIQDSIVFTSKKTVVSGLPNSVIFNYDITKADFDSAFVQQDWDRRKRQRISKDDNFHTSIYYYPGYYDAKLVLNNTVVKKFPLMITTDGWLGIYRKQRYQEVPIYLNDINLDEGSLHVSIDDLKNNNIDDVKDFHIGFYNVRDFGEIYCDNYIFEASIKNNSNEGGLICGYSEVIVKGETGRMITSFGSAGCVSKYFIQFGNTYIDGSKNDLSALACDLNDWKKIRYKVKNNDVSISIDNQQVYKLSYTNNLGKITCLSFNFYGCGQAKDIMLSDTSGQVRYRYPD